MTNRTLAESLADPPKWVSPRNERRAEKDAAYQRECEERAVEERRLADRSLWEKIEDAAGGNETLKELLNELFDRTGGEK